MYQLSATNEYTYHLKIFGEYSNEVYQTILQKISTCHFDHDTNRVYFSAETVIPFSKYISEHEVQYIQLIDDISSQMTHLIQLDHCFFGFDINNILVIDHIFIICSSQYVMPIRNNLITFTCPIKIPYFTSPEIFKMSILPSKLNYKCGYYSLGSLIVKLILDEHLIEQSEEEVEDIIRPLKNTKIYWFLKRCFYKKVENRRLLLI